MTQRPLLPVISGKIVLRIVLTVIVLAVLGAILVDAWTALVPFFLGLIFAYLLLPVVKYLDFHGPKMLRQRGLSRPLAIIIVYIVLIGLFSSVLSYFVPVIGDQATALAKAVPSYIERVRGLFEYDVVALWENVPLELRQAAEANLAKATGTLLDAAQKGLELTWNTVTQTISFIIGLVIVPFWLFYVLNDADKAGVALESMVPESIREDVRCIAALIDGLLSAYIRGQFLLCLLVGLLATTVLTILGVEQALLLGTFAGVFEIIPFLGPYLGAIPAVLVALARRPITALWVAISFALIQQIENIFLVPRISGSAVRFHPAVVMVIVVVGSEVAGLLGVLLAVPVAAMFRDVFHYLYLRTGELGATPQMALDRVRAPRARI